jgi:hypothetical protein
MSALNLLKPRLVDEGEKQWTKMAASNLLKPRAVDKRTEKCK